MGTPRKPSVSGLRGERTSTGMSELWPQAEAVKRRHAALLALSRP